MKIFSDLLGLDVESRDLTLIQVSVRAVIVFLAALAMVRLADKRFLAKLSAFDTILGFMLASMLARVVNGSGPFLPTLGAGFVLVGLHRLLAMAAYRSKRAGWWFKGEPEVVVENGALHEEHMRSNNLSEADLLEEARLNSQVDEVTQIRRAVIERNGHVSVIPFK